MRNFDLDARSLAPSITLSRRAFAKASLIAGGFTLAAGPINAKAIETPADGLEAGTVAIPTRDGEIPGYAARPAKSGTVPVVLVVQEIFGVHRYIQDVCRRFARQGYAAIAPEMFYRQGDVSGMGMGDLGQLIKIAQQVPDKQAMSDLDAAAAFLKAEFDGDTDSMGITGFCWGGRIVWLYAAHNPALRAGVAWYGRLTGNSDAKQPKHPIDIVDRLKAPILGLYGAQDQGIPVSDVEKMREALAKAGKDQSEIVVYQDAGHAFHADYRPSYNESAAEDGWRRALDWFAMNGVT